MQQYKKYLLIWQTNPDLVAANTFCRNYIVRNNDQTLIITTLGRYNNPFVTLLIGNVIRAALRSLLNMFAFANQFLGCSVAMTATLTASSSSSKLIQIPPRLKRCSSEGVEMEFPKWLEVRSKSKHRQGEPLSLGTGSDRITSHTTAAPILRMKESCGIEIKPPHHVLRLLFPASYPFTSTSSVVRPVTFQH